MRNKNPRGLKKDLGLKGFVDFQAGMMEKTNIQTKPGKILEFHD